MKHTIGQGKFWVYSTAFVMSFNGGYINAVTLVSILKNAVGYVTGNLTLIGQSFTEGYFTLSFHLLVLVTCFLIGSVLSALIIQGQNFKIGRQYTRTLLTQLALVVIATFMLFKHLQQAGYLLALLMGMQNAMTTHYGTALIRTTHMTGTMTDLGVLLAHWIKGYAIAFWKLYLYLCLIFGFSCGSILGAIAYSKFHALALFACVLFYMYMICLRYVARSAAPSVVEA